MGETQFQLAINAVLKTEQGDRIESDGDDFLENSGKAFLEMDSDLHVCEFPAFQAEMAACIKGLWQQPAWCS